MVQERTVRTYARVMRIMQCQASSRRLRALILRMPPRLRRALLRWKWASKALSTRKVLARARCVAAALGAASIQTRRPASGFRAWLQDEHKLRLTNWDFVLGFKQVEVQID